MKPKAKRSPPKGGKPFYTIDEFCEMVGISRRTYFRWRLDEKVPRETQVGFRVLIKAADIEEWGARQ